MNLFMKVVRFIVNGYCLGPIYSTLTPHKLVKILNKVIKQSYYLRYGIKESKPQRNKKGTLHESFAIKDLCC